MYTLNPEDDALRWEDTQDDNSRKFEMDCEALVDDPRFNPATYTAVCEALEWLTEADESVFNDILYRAHRHGTREDYERLGMFLMRASQDLKSKEIEEFVRSGVAWKVQGF